MARRGDALYLRGKSWYLDCCINGVRYQRLFGKDITRSVALYARHSIKDQSKVFEFVEGTTAGCQNGSR